MTPVQNWYTLQVWNNTIRKVFCWNLVVTQALYELLHMTRKKKKKKQLYKCVPRVE